MSQPTLDQLINPALDPKRLHRHYIAAKPFPHVVIDDFLVDDVANALYQDFPSHQADFWYHYSNPIEEKLACNRFEHMPVSIAQVLKGLNGQATLDFLGELSGIENLQSDAGLNGGGMHCIRNGGKLDVHIDYSIHPTLALERRMNLIVYLNKDWREEFGGALELWDQTIENCVAKVVPAFNRAVIFETGDKSYHGHPNPLTCPDDVSRKSIALYYLTEPRAGATERYRARFVARPQDDKSTEMEEFRAKRSGLETGPELYRKK